MELALYTNFPVFNKESRKYELFILRGLCKDSDIDRGYFLLGGETRSANGRPIERYSSRQTNISSAHMKPVYEGYFYIIHWISKNGKIGGNLK